MVVRTVFALSIFSYCPKPVRFLFVFFFLTYFLYPSFRLLVPLTLLPIILMVPHRVTRTVLVSYGVRYVIVGELERQKYPALQEWKFGQLGEVAFQSGQTTIYQMR